MNPLTVSHWTTLHGLVALAGLLLYGLDSHARRQRRHPSAAIAWVISLALLPYVAIPLYLVFGTRKVRFSAALKAWRKRQQRSARDAACFTAEQNMAWALGLAPAASIHDLRIHEDGASALRTLKSCVREATTTLDVCSFLLGRDAVGVELTALLVASAQRGVRVRLLIDGVGYFLGRCPSLRELRAAGVRVELFVSPLRSSLRGRTNLRNHRKMVIADAQRLWTGGRNLAAEYFEGDPTIHRKHAAWVDLSFDLRGDLVAQAHLQFNHDWAFATGKPQTGATLGQDHGQQLAVLPAGSGARLVPSGPDQMEDTLHTMVVSRCFTAKLRILAVSPYFVPDETLLMALTLAARRGVKVDLLLPRMSNHHLADIARHASMRDMVAAGADIWLLPHMVHAKAVIFDDDLALVGSANLDERSMFLNYELMVAFYEHAHVAQFSRWIESHSRRASPYQSHQPSLARELLEGMVRWLAFQL